MNFSKDFLYDAVGVIYWSYIEAATGIIVGSVVTFRPLFSSAHEKLSVLFSSNKSGSWPDPKAKKPLTIGDNSKKGFKRHKDDSLMVTEFDSQEHLQGTETKGTSATIIHEEIELADKPGVPRPSD